MAVIEITLLFLGSIIGAGFATGAEIVTFFGMLHLSPWLVAALVGCATLMIIIWEINLICPRTKNEMSVPLTYHPHRFAKIQDMVFIVIYFILFTAMTAGVNQITNVTIGILSLTISAMIVLFGFEKLSHFNFYIVLLIIVLIVTTALPHLAIVKHANNFSDLPVGIFWAFLYAGLNCFILPELITAAAEHYPRRTLLRASTITALLITGLVGLVLTTITNTNTQNAAMPLYAAAPNHLTMVVILLAILTSQYSALFAITTRVQRFFPIQQKRPFGRIVIICGIALLGSFCGFNQIINFAYPLIGAFTCVYLFLTWLVVWQQRRRQSQIQQS